MLLRRDGEARISRADPLRHTLELTSRGNGMPAPERHGGLLRPEVTRLIAERNFAVAFQPVVRLSDCRPVGHEALLRLPPQGTLHRSTRLFVDAAQAWNLGAALDEAVLDVTLATWPRTAQTPVSVNVCASSLGDPVFFARLLTRVAGEGATLAVEITGIDAADPSAVIAVVPALRGVGMRVILDDFTSSDACLAAVQATRFDEVKLWRGGGRGSRERARAKIASGPGGTGRSHRRARCREADRDDAAGSDDRASGGEIRPGMAVRRPGAAPGRAPQAHARGVAPSRPAYCMDRRARDGTRRHLERSPEDCKEPGAFGWGVRLEPVPRI